MGVAEGREAVKTKAMRSGSPPLYLPVTEKDARRLLDAGVAPAGSIECAALFVAIMQCNLQMAEHGAPAPMTTPVLMRYFRESLPLFVADPAEGARTLSMLAAQRPRTIRQMCQILHGLNISFAPAGAGGLAAADAPFDIAAYQSQCLTQMEPCSIALAPPYDEDSMDSDGADGATAPPARLEFSGYRGQRTAAAVIAADRDERIYVQAYAGTGKTHLLREIMARASDLTYVAPTLAHSIDIQQYAKMGRVLSPTAFVNRVSSRFPWHEHGFSRPVTTRVSSEVSLQQQIEALSIEDAEGIQAAQVLRLAWRALSAWCKSDSPAMTEQDVERAIARDIAHLNRTSTAKHVHRAAKRLWGAMFASPRRSPLGGRLLLSQNHLAKWLVLHDARLPAEFDPIITDEAHDIPGGVLSLMSRHHRGVILMGDSHQSLRMERGPQAGFKTVSICESVRTGVGPERLINSLIEVSGGNLGESFEANRHHLTRIEGFDARYRPLDVDLWVYGDVQAMLNGILAARAAGDSPRVLPASAHAADRELERLEYLLQINGGAPGKDWISKAGSAGFVRLRDYLLKQGASGIHELRRACKNAEAHAGPAVCLVEHAKNIQVQTVVMDASCSTTQGRPRDRYAARATYQCVTRAHGRIWVPGSILP